MPSLPLSETTVEAPTCRCGVCGDEVGEESGIACASCFAPHHPDCWAFNTGCSIFGCGGQTSMPQRELAGVLESRGLTITETTRPPMRWAPILQGLTRRLLSRGRFLPRTLTAGVLGSLLGVGVGIFLGVDFLDKPMVVGGFLGSGLLYGLLAPFLAPFQVRHPRFLGGLSFLVFTSMFVVMDSIHIRGVIGGVGLAVIFAWLLLFATSFGEALAGPRTWLAALVRGRAGALRMLATWLAFVFGFAVLAYLDAGRWPDWRMLQDILGASLVISASGGTAMESGKQAFLEAVENRLPPRLPET